MCIIIQSLAHKPIISTFSPQDRNQQHSYNQSDHQQHTGKENYFFFFIISFCLLSADI